MKIVYESGDRVRIKTTGRIEVVDQQVDGIYPPIVTKEGGMYSREELEPADSARRVFLLMLEGQPGAFYATEGMELVIQNLIPEAEDEDDDDGIEQIILNAIVLSDDALEILINVGLNQEKTGELEAKHGERAPGQSSGPGKEGPGGLHQEGQAPSGRQSGPAQSL